MKAAILSLDGTKKSDAELPSFFTGKVRADLIARAFNAERAGSRHPYGASRMAGKRASAPGKIRHRRRVWKTSYGLGISRVPRKVLTQRGRRFYWQGAFAPGTVGGRRAHPPKAEKIWELKINKKEQILALKSAIAATNSLDVLKEKYDINTVILPLIVERKIEEINKVKEVKKILTTLLKTKNFFPKRKVRAGKGTMRGRKHRKSAGLLFVVSKASKLKKTKAFDVKEAKNITVSDLSPGGKPGRITIYSHAAIVDLEQKFKPKTK